MPAMPRSVYREFQTAETRGWVEAFWSSTAGGGATRILPDGCFDFIFDLDSGHGTVVGAMTASKLVASRPGTRRFGVRFSPGTAGALLEPAAWELTDQSAQLADVCRAAQRDGLGERIAAARDDGARARIVASYLNSGGSRMRARDARVLRAIEQLRGAHGARPIAVLAADLGIGERQLERLFQQHVATRPKLFARVLRVQRALAALERDGGTQAAHAQTERFADEAHLVREFRALTGLTPQRLLAERDVGFVQEPLATP